MKTKAIALTVEERPGFFQRLKLWFVHLVKWIPDLTIAMPDTLNQKTLSGERRLVVGGKVIIIRTSVKQDI